MYSLSNKACTDLDSILDYFIINFGSAVMLNYHESLEKCFEILSENPDLGNEIEYVRLDYMCFKHRSHLIFYKKISQGIMIVRILHKSMDAPRYF